MALSNKNMVCALRLGVIGHVAQAFWNGRLAETVDRISHDMRSRNGRKQTRCCIYKDRAILRERIIAALGFRLKDEQDDSIPLRQFAQRALEEQTPKRPFSSSATLPARAAVWAGPVCWAAGYGGSALLAPPAAVPPGMRA